MLIAPLACASRISGTYVAHGRNFAEQLQLTETNNGQVTGALSMICLKHDGSVKSEQYPMSGTVDGGQLNLNAKLGNGLLSLLPGATFAGTVSGNTIRLQVIDGGSVNTDVFTRATVATFEAYANELKSRGVFIANSKRVTDRARQLRELARRAEFWIANAELFAQKIPEAKGRYRQIEDRMQSLIVAERQTGDALARGQISLAAGQENLAGGQVDLAVNQAWDVNIENEGTSLNGEFAGGDGSCTVSPDQRKRAGAQSLQDWEKACKQAVAERHRFLPVFKDIMQQGAELKSFQAAAQERRKVLMDKASQLVNVSYGSPN